MFHSLGSWLRSTSVAGTTEAQRSSERNKRAVASALAGLLLRGSSFVVVLVTVPLTLDLLGPIRFGMWMTIASIAALLGFTDLGIGNGVMSHVAGAYGRGDANDARRYLASGLASLLIVASVLGCLFAFAYVAVPWADVFNVATDATASVEAGPAVAVFVVTFLLALPLGLAAQIRFAFQEGFAQSAFYALGNGITLGLLVAAVIGRASLPMLVLALTAGPLIASILNLGVMLLVQRKWLRPMRGDFTLGGMRAVLVVGLAYFVLQIAYVVAFSSDRFVIAQTIGPAAVADYSVAHRLFSIPLGLAVAALQPLWPAYREALSRSDFVWVRTTLRRSLVIAVAATVPVALVLIPAGPVLVDWWTGGVLTPTFALYPVLAAFTVSYAVATAFSMLFNGAQALRFQLTVWCLMACLNIALSVALAYRIGVVGVPVSSAVVVLLVLIVPSIVYAPRLLRHLAQLPRSQPEARDTSPLSSPEAR